MSYTPGSSEWRENEALKAELNALAIRQGRAPSWPLEDQREALRDAFAAGFLHRPGRDPHPLASEYLKAGPMSYVRLAEQCLALAGHRVAADGDGFNAIRAALRTADFPSIIEETARGLAEARQSTQLADLLALTAQLEVPTYAAQSYSMVDLDNLPAPGATTLANYVFPTVKLTGEPIQTFGVLAKILITRQALTNDDRNLVRAAVNAFLAAAHRNEMKTLAALLEANATLEDGTALFATAKGNLVTAALDSGGLASAFAALRETPVESGDPADAACSAILVHSDDEVGTLELVEALPEPRRPRVVATANLATAGAWYVFASPITHPAIGRVRMVGAPESAVTFGGMVDATQRDPVTGEIREYPGVALEATHNVGYSVLSRIGVVKCSKT